MLDGHLLVGGLVATILALVVSLNAGVDHVLLDVSSVNDLGATRRTRYFHVAAVVIDELVLVSRRLPARHVGVALVVQVAFQERHVSDPFAPQTLVGAAYVDRRQLTLVELVQNARQFLGPAKGTVAILGLSDGSGG